MNIFKKTKYSLGLFDLSPKISAPHLIHVLFTCISSRVTFQSLLGLQRGSYSLWVTYVIVLKPSICSAHRISTRNASYLCSYHFCHNLWRIFKRFCVASLSLSLSLVAKSYLTLATTWTAARQAPLSMGVSRQESWSGLPFPSPEDLPDPGIEPGSPALQADSLRTELQGKPLCSMQNANEAAGLLASYLEGVILVVKGSPRILKAEVTCYLCPSVNQSCVCPHCGHSASLWVTLAFACSFLRVNATHPSSQNYQSNCCLVVAQLVFPGLK